MEQLWCLSARWFYATLLPLNAPTCCFNVASFVGTVKVHRERELVAASCDAGCRWLNHVRAGGFAPPPSISTPSLDS